MVWNGLDVAVRMNRGRAVFVSGLKAEICTGAGFCASEGE
jgi:hypothetical protein